MQAVILFRNLRRIQEIRFAKNFQRKLIIQYTHAYNNYDQLYYYIICFRADITSYIIKLFAV